MPSAWASAHGSRFKGGTALLLHLFRVVLFFAFVRILFSFSHTNEVCMSGMEQDVPVCSGFRKGSQKSPETGCMERLGAV